MSRQRIVCPNDGRKIRLLISALLKKWVIDNAFVQNGFKHYECIDWKIKKTEKKLVLFSVSSDKQGQFLPLIEQIAGRKQEKNDIHFVERFG